MTAQGPIAVQGPVALGLPQERSQARGAENPNLRLVQTIAA